MKKTLFKLLFIVALFAGLCLAMSLTASAEDWVWCDNCGFTAPLCEECGDCLFCEADNDNTCGDCNTCGGCNYKCILCEGCMGCGDFDELCYNCGVICNNCMEEGGFCQDCGLCMHCVDGANGWACWDCLVCKDCAPENTCAECEECLPCHGDFCESCRLCNACVLLCTDCMSRCSECSRICGICLERCEECVDVMCDGCDNCSECVLFCDDCDMCEECVELCPSCESNCAECYVVCPDCGVCEECATVCLDCGICEDCAPLCEDCQLCGDCTELCDDCETICYDCAEGWCDDCGNCFDCVDLCEGCLSVCIDCADLWCDLCESCDDCVDMCEDCGEICSECAEGWCEECNRCDRCIRMCTDCGDICELCSDAWCYECGACEDCIEICKECNMYCVKCVNTCSECGICENCVEVCDACGLCPGCCECEDDVGGGGDENPDDTEPPETPNDPTHIHSVKRVGAKRATCTEDGNSLYYACSCGKWFYDKDANNEIKNKDSIITFAGHSYSSLVAAVEPVHTVTRLKSGMKAHYVCTECDAFFDVFYRETTEDALVIPAPTHDFNGDWDYRAKNGHAHVCSCGATDTVTPHTPGAEATETTAQTCTDCGYVINDMLNHVHKLSLVEGKDATCTENGSKDYYLCDCGARYEDPEGKKEVRNESDLVIAAGHSYGSLIPGVDTVHTETEAKGGSLPHYQCSECNKFFNANKKQVTEKSISIPAPQHEFADANGNGKCDSCEKNAPSAPIGTKDNIIVEDGVATVPDTAIPETDGEDVKIDVSDVNGEGEKTVDKVIMEKETLDKLVSDNKGVSVQFKNVTVTVDKGVISGIRNGDGNGEVTVTVSKTDKKELTDGQKDALENEDVQAVVNVEIFVDEVKLEDAPGGGVTVSIPVDPKGSYKVVVLDNNGGVKEIPVKPEGGNVSFEVDGVSAYAVIKTSEAFDNGLLIAVIIIIIVLAAATVVAFVIYKNKQKAKNEKV